MTIIPKNKITNSKLVFRLKLISVALTLLLVLLINNPLASEEEIKEKPSKGVTPLPGQELLVKKYKGRIEQFFLFSDPTPELLANDRAQYKPWTESEKDQIKEAINYIAQRAPGLILQASHGRRIKLNRKKQHPSNSYFSEIQGCSECPAFSSGKEIYITDAAFSNDNDNNKVTLPHALTHELTHVADYGQRWSMSPDWVHLAAKSVIFLHRVQASNSQAGLWLLDAPATYYYDLPSGYCACDLHEALAETVSFYICGAYKPSAAKLSFINNTLLSEPSNPTDFVAMRDKAKDCLTKGDYAEAIALYKEAIKQNPTDISTRLELSSAYLEMHALKEGLAEADTCVSMCKSMGAPTFEKMYNYSYKQRACLLHHMGREREARIAQEQAYEHFHEDNMTCDDIKKSSKETPKSAQQKVSGSSKKDLIATQKTSKTQTESQNNQASKNNREEVYVIYDPFDKCSTIWNISHDQFEYPTEKLRSFPCAINDILWLDDNESFVFLAKMYSNSPLHLFCVNARTHLTKDLTAIAGGAVKAFYFDRDKKELVVQLTLKDATKSDLYRVDPKTGAMRLEAPQSILPNETILATHSTQEEDYKGIKPGRINYSSMYCPYARLYRPPLPGQKQLINKYKDRLGQFFYFSQDSSTFMGASTKPWSEAEIAILKASIDDIANRMPAIALNASRGERIQLMRISNAQKSVTSDQYQSTACKDAITDGTAIAFTDSFFNNSKCIRTGIITNRLTCLADYEGRLSLKRNWLKAIMPNVALMRSALSYNPGKADDEVLLAIANCYCLPSKDSMLSSSDALAEATRAYTCSEFKPPTSAREFIDKYLLTAPNFELDFVNDTVIKKADKLINANDYKGAITLLTDLINKDKQFFPAYYHRARAYRLQGQYNLASADIDRNIDLLRARGAGVQDKYFFRSICEIIYIHQAKTKTAGTKKVKMAALISRQKSP